MKRPTYFVALFSLLAATAALLVGAAGYWWIARDLPKMITIEDYRPALGSRVIAKENGQEVLVGEFFEERRYITPVDRIPDLVKQAFLAAEDDQFFQHQGISLAAILRAGFANFKAGHTVQGGSTITQQVAKSLFLDSDRNILRKLKEVILSNRLEKNLSKDQILYLYLNQIYLGMGAHGIEAAAQVYFHKSVKDLKLEEVALLAGLPKAPSSYDPFKNPKRAKERQAYVLGRMLENKFITPEIHAAAVKKPLKIFHVVDTNEKYAPYLIEHIRRELGERLGPKALLEDGYTIYIPGSPKMFVAAARSLQESVREMDRKQGYRGPKANLSTPEEVEKFLKSQRDQLLRKQFPFAELMPEGQIQHAIKSEDELIGAGDFVEGVVSEIEEKKGLWASVATLRFFVPISQLNWTRPPKGPKTVSEVFRKGDLIYLKMKREGVGAASKWVAELDQEPKLQGALFAMEAKTGHVLAMVGGYSFEKSQFNRANQAKRQPGSSFKPVIYSAAIESGYTAASILEDSPLVFEDETAGKWKPTNYEEKFHGDTTLRQALILSRNIPTIRLVEALGVGTIINYARRLGMSSEFPPDLSIALGSAPATLNDLVKTYALFPRGGSRVEPVYFLKVLDRTGKVVEKESTTGASVDLKALPAASATPTVTGSLSPTPAPSPSGSNGRESKFPPDPSQPELMLDPRVAYVMTHLLQGVVESGTATGAKELKRPCAGKTGTTNEYKDAWFIGFTPTIVAGSWVGYDDSQSLGREGTGGKAALPIWLGFMQEAVKDYPEEDFVPPSGVNFQTIHFQTGKIVDSKSAGARKEAFIDGTEPRRKLGETSGEPSGDSGEFIKEDE